MGRKFTSIHVINSNIDEVLSRLWHCQIDWRRKQKDLFRVLREQNKLDLSTFAEVVSINKSIFGPKKITFYLVNNNSNISVFSEFFGSQAIKDTIKFWFKGFDKYILIVDYFDDDFLEIQVFKKDKFVTSLVAGCNLEPYELTPAKFDESVISTVFNIQPDEIEKAYNTDDIFQTCSNFADLFKLPLTLQANDVKDSKQLNVVETSYDL